MKKRLLFFTTVATATVFLFLGVSCAQEDPRDSDSPYGVLAFLAWDHDWNQYHFGGDKVEKAAALMKEAGIGFVRMDFLWTDIELVPNRFDFRKYDKIVDSLTKNGIKIVGLLEYNPAWSGGDWNAAPDRALYVKYASAVVKHYGDKVKYWEIWNEPDSPFYWKPQDNLKSYAELLKAVYPAMKQVDPSCRVLMGGLASTYSVNLKRLYQHGAGKSFDIVNIHPFVDPLKSNALERLRGEYRGIRRVMEANGDGEKEIWFTEIGCPGVKTPDRTNGWWEGLSPTEAQQALWVEKIYTEPLAWKGVKKIFWAFFRDTPGHFKSGVDTFGLVRDDFSKKPAFEAYKNTAKKLKGLKV